MAADLAIAALAIFGVAAVLGAALLRWKLAKQIRGFTTNDETVLQYQRNSRRGTAGGRERKLELLQIAETIQQAHRAPGNNGVLASQLTLLRAIRRRVAAGGLSS